MLLDCSSSFGREPCAWQNSNEIVSKKKKSQEGNLVSFKYLHKEAGL